MSHLRKDRFLRTIDLPPTIGGRIGLILSAALLLTACSGHRLVAQVADSVPPEERTISAIVVRDLAHDSECNFGSGKAGIVLDRHMASAKSLVSDQWLQAYVKPEMWMRMRNLTGSLRRANDDDRLVDWEIPESGELKIVDLSAVSQDATEHLLATVRCFATFLMPVVSSDGNSALVSVHVGPSPHGTVAFYILVKVRGEWIIFAREHFVFM